MTEVWPSVSSCPVQSYDQAPSFRNPRNGPLVRIQMQQLSGAAIADRGVVVSQVERQNTDWSSKGARANGRLCPSLRQLAKRSTKQVGSVVVVRPVPPGWHTEGHDR